MNIPGITIGMLTILMSACAASDGQSSDTDAGLYSDIRIAGAMKNVMWKGELGSSIDLDTISLRDGLYGLGPAAYLRGELMINDGEFYISKVTSDSTMIVERRSDVSAPFFVYANVADWRRIELPEAARSIADLEAFIDLKTMDQKRPFAFKLQGQVAKAIIHVQNLPPGAKVSSPDDAHRGQVKYGISNEAAVIVGFFSTTHQGIFTHHDSFVHMHLITEDESHMGHLDELEIGQMTLYLPK